MTMELGMMSFGSLENDPATGKRVSTAQGIRNLVEAIRVAEEVGLDWFGVGEHHSFTMPSSSPATVLAAAAMVTNRIRLSSAISVIGADDPVRVYQQFAIVDAVSNGRAEIIAGRGSAADPFKLFGHSLEDYDGLFAENYELLLKLDESERITWSSTFRAPLENAEVVPRPEQSELPIWLGTNGNPNSVIRAANLHSRIFFSIVGGDPIRLKPLVELYREASAQTGTPEHKRTVGFGALGFIADDGPAARSGFYDRMTERTNDMGGTSRIPRPLYDRQVAPGGSFFIGDPEEITERILTVHEQLGPDRFGFESDWGRMPHRDLLHHIELLGTVVKPAVDRELGTAATS
ncbi:LLM class flavin-dependent oxidoreductase [Herbiconiux liukaitaii]|uniref:LLM class flavin-dependent oxidoreductase n=1 Tax=Herbiconiux liukaitaii TaxID=3342799 RepID=UPI0035B6EA69